MSAHLLHVTALLAQQAPAEGMVRITEWVSLSRWPGYALWGAGLLLLGALYLSYRAVRGAPRPVVVGLLILRALLAGLVFAVILEPGVRDLDTTPEPNLVILAVDSSASMAEPDGASGRPRYDGALAAAQALYTQLEAQPAHRPHLVLFDDAVRAMPEAPPATATGAGTVLRGPLETADTLARGKLGGLVLFTDGNDTDGLLAEDVQKLVEGLQGPVHTVLAAQPEAFRDVAIDRVLADEFAFVRNPLTFQVVLRHRGFSGLTLPLSLAEDGQPIATKQITLSDTDETIVDFTFEPKTAGKHIYTLSCPPRPEERIVENNRFDFAVKIIRDRIRVLQVAGRPSWDERFVRRLLKENPSVDLISFFILRSPSDNAAASNQELSLIPFPTRELFTEQLHTFDVVILQDFNYRPYQMGMYLANIRDFVTKNGGGLLMIGGSLSFSEGAYDNTPIADILPVTLWPGPGHIDEERFTPRLTKAGRSHPITQLGDLGRGDDPFAQLPALAGINLVRGVAPGGEVLLSHPFLNADGEAHPVIAVREVENGRSMAILTDSTWTWSLPHVGAGGRGDVHRRLFANALRWLIRDPELSRVQVAAEQSVAFEGEPVDIEVRTFDPKYRPQGDADVVLEVRRLDEPGAEPVVLRAQSGADGTARFSFDPPAAGPYRVNARASEKGPIGSDVDAFVVRKGSLEARHLQPRDGLPRALAERSGGEVVGLDEATSLRFEDHERRKVHRQSSRPIWDQAWVVALLCLVAAAEWWWRRRRGFA